MSWRKVTTLKNMCKRLLVWVIWRQEVLLGLEGCVLRCGAWTLPAGTSGDEPASVSVLVTSRSWQASPPTSTVTVNAENPLSLTSPYNT
ncbi:hypothetical protein E2C01_004445 [Portunus trituberculatus]|uniref:Uncharacterized protein n=1 Tax=Portunus trituberculatus TaxID=210409 RepID=A0A5B7CQQ1_PORTR|nr:hypothetical protein [Portunus trituberculatus]